LLRLAELLALPVAEWRDRVNFPAAHPLYQGYAADALLRSADVVLILDHDVPYIPTRTSVAPEATVVQVDLDPVKERIPLWTFPVDLPVRADTARALDVIAGYAGELLTDADRRRVESRRAELATSHARLRDEWNRAALEQASARPIAPEWLGYCLEQLRREHPSIVIRETDKILPQYVISKIYEATGGNCYVVTGVGQHQMWAAQFFWYDRPNSFITSGGLGTMGFEVPAAIGVQLAAPNDTVWSIAGDGGFQMTMQELATVVEYDLPIKYAIINNSYLGMVRQWQELFYKNNLVATPLKNPDFVKLAEAFGMKGLRVSDKHQVTSAIAEAMNHPGPVLVEFIVDEAENCYPMVPPGAALQETIDLPNVVEQIVGARR
jgi:thiamine pyrophosphate-dependent acetolactate synthase large subunit-like protein